ncbi:hypothetical protein Bca52824_027152 [Brassica carinata]|uniref:Uncharacterized protein n=1 Tax=Brassica carinata TaxID=52824 RepID=A0A8X7SLI2_BRACI|nr:hypothetical protein Bca52824_027152 [Brassica carinata]
MTLDTPWIRAEGTAQARKLSPTEPTRTPQRTGRVIVDTDPLTIETLILADSLRESMYTRDLALTNAPIISMPRDRSMLNREKNLARQRYS